MTALHRDPIRPPRDRWCPECYRLTGKYHPDYTCNECGETTVFMPDGGVHDDDPRVQTPGRQRMARPRDGRGMRPR